MRSQQCYLYKVSHDATRDGIYLKGCTPIITQETFELPEGAPLSLIREFVKYIFRHGSTAWSADAYFLKHANDDEFQWYNRSSDGRRVVTLTDDDYKCKGAFIVDFAENRPPLDYRQIANYGRFHPNRSRHDAYWAAYENRCSQYQTAMIDSIRQVWDKSHPHLALRIYDNMIHVINKYTGFIDAIVYACGNKETECILMAVDFSINHLPTGSATRIANIENPHLAELTIEYINSQCSQYVPIDIDPARDGHSEDDLRRIAQLILNGEVMFSNYVPDALQWEVFSVTKSMFTEQIHAYDDFGYGSFYGYLDWATENRVAGYPVLSWSKFINKADTTKLIGYLAKLGCPTGVSTNPMHQQG